VRYVLEVSVQRAGKGFAFSPALCAPALSAETGCAPALSAETGCATAYCLADKPPNDTNRPFEPMKVVPKIIRRRTAPTAAATRTPPAIAITAWLPNAAGSMLRS
jgi:hypothetical protein